MTTWGIHNDYYDTELVDEGFVSIGWEGVPDLRSIGPDRDKLKSALSQALPTAKAGAIPVWAGVLLRFGFEMQVGDVVVAPRKSDSTLNFGVVDGPYDYYQGAGRHPHRRKVRWLRTGVARSGFSQEVLYEVGSAVTLFQVRKGAEVFDRFLANDPGVPAEEIEPVHRTAADLDVAVQDEPNADRIDQHTRDFIASVLLRQLSTYEFEEFSAALLRAMGYEARVTPPSSDGGVDVIAHKDPLGLEPPLIKVQCKRTTASQGRPEVQKLIGTLGDREVGLFITLGTYSKDAVDLERGRQNVRLLTGADVATLVLAHYDRLEARWRALLPLRRVLVVDREPG